MKQNATNINKIKPAVRTKGVHTGNFGMPKVKGANNNQLGLTNIENIHRIVNKDEYLARMYEAFEKADTQRLRDFCFQEIRRILIQRNLWEQPQ